MVLRKSAWSIHDSRDKNCNIFSLKVKKLDEEVIDILRVSDFGTLIKDHKLLKICATRMRSIVVSTIPSGELSPVSGSSLDPLN